MLALAAGRPDAVALIDGVTDERLTYAALATRVAAAAAELRAAVAPGGLAFLFVANDVGSIVAWLGALAAGVPVALFDRALDAAMATALVARYQPDVVWGRALAPGGGGPPTHPGLALLMSTSGSTGSPKLVRLAASAVAANAQAIAAGLAIGPGEVAPTSLPMHYAYGLSVISSHLAAGAAVLVTSEGVLADGFWRACRTHQITSLAGVPFTYQILRRLDLARLAPSTLTTFTQAGGAMAPALIDDVHARAAARGGRLVVMYGQTEATARISMLAGADLPAHRGSVGRAVAGGAITIERAGQAVAPGEVGDVVFRGPNVMMGYADDRADLARGDELAGVLRTGDRGRLDGDGRLWLSGRPSRFAKVFGQRVSLDELEALAATAPGHPVVAAVAAGEHIRVVVDGAADGLRPYLAQRTGLHPSAFVVDVVAALPRLASGKIDYPGLEAS